jgi:cobyrinic acid a,c-diamide synthase
MRRKTSGQVELAMPGRPMRHCHDVARDLHQRREHDARIPATGEHQPRGASVPDTRADRVDEALPEAAGALVLAGGFPEVFGSELEANARMRAAVAAFPGPILAECGGLLFLCRELDGHQMCGVLPATARMAGRLTLGYREATVATSTPWLDAGARVRGHEFHYSQVETSGSPAWTLAARGRERPDGVVAGNVQAGYLHVHWAAYPEIARRFARAAMREPIAA